MNKFFLLAVVCLLGTAAADTRYRRGILPGDARYNSNGYDYPVPAPQHVPAASQPARTYQQQVQKAAPSNQYLTPNTAFQRPQTTYVPAKTAPVAHVHSAPSFQVEQVRSVEQNSYTEVTHHHQPAQTYGVPVRHVQPAATASVKQSFAIPHNSYGTPIVASAATHTAVPHKTYGAPSVSAAASTPVHVPHKTYGAPQVNSAPSVSVAVSAPAPAPAPVRIPHQTYGTPAVAAVNTVASVSAPVVHQTYEAPAVHHEVSHDEVHHISHEVAAPVSHSFHSAPVQHTVHAAPAHHSFHSAPVRQAYTVQSYAAPVQHSASHESYVQEELPHVAPAPAFRDNHVHHHVENSYIPPAVESESVSVESHNTASSSSSHQQAIGENGGYVY